MELELQRSIEQWFVWDQHEPTRAQLKALVASNAVEELRSRLLTRMEFGTAGLRSSMGVGNAHMNCLTILQTTQGLLRYLEHVFGAENVKSKGVVVSFDARHNSELFAKIVGQIFDHAGVRVYKFSRFTPTPFVPFTVLQKGCVCGIMVTASHNPKDDNGYKVYWDNGAQIIPPHDIGIATEIERNLEPWASSWTNSFGNNIIDPYQEIYPLYFQAAKKLQKFPDLCKSTSIRATYTAMHGVGAEFTAESLKTFGFPSYIPVAEQVLPDPDFPTVAFPNPEEGKSALNLAMATADRNQSTLILANDPDADRLAVAERQPNGTWKVFTGNELGSLLGWWRWETCEKRPGQKYAMLHSTVSSAFLQTMGKAEGFHAEDTLTGFKWMGNRCVELQREGYEVLFCFEEAIGFMCGTAVRDKDGVSAAACVYELASYLEQRLGRTLTEQLQVLMKQYGSHLTASSYFVCKDPKTTKKLFDEIRNYRGTGKYPTSLGNFRVSAVRDLTVGYDSTTKDNKPLLPTSPAAQMITFTLSTPGGDQAVITVRGSGTEPKIKYYAEMITKNASATVSTFEQQIEIVVNELYQPSKFKLSARPKL
eukprot:PhF_6_TR28080/c0_g1_i1/m.41485/K15779/PGM2; phosphoglucomutase / phosphopentomutase